MKKLSAIAYRALFFKHVWRFLGNVTHAHELRAPQVVAVSGGLDSMALLWLAQSLYKQHKLGPVRALFVHHHTRPGQNQDAALIQEFCGRENIPFKLLDAEGLSTETGNFEARARIKRKQLIEQELSKGELLWQGHHLDDSYEWFLMQRSRSNHLKSSLGIPVRNGHIVRPFLCLSRAQIARLVQFEKIPFREDPTNQDLRYDRNYLRHEVIPAIRRRYPKFLKHYAYSSNYSAMLLNLSVTNRIQNSQIHVFDQGAVISGAHFSETQVQELIHDYSSTDRGELVTPIQRMFKAMDNGKRGPFNFSGKVDAFYSYHLLMIYCRNLKNHDESIAMTLAQLSKSDLMQMPSYKRVELKQAWENLLKRSDAMLNMPGLVLVLESDSICKTINTSVYHPLFPLVSQVCQQKGLRFIPFAKCLDLWQIKRDKLPEKLRLLPLCNLSNLFSSQAIEQSLII